MRFPNQLQQRNSSNDVYELTNTPGSAYGASKAHLRLQPLNSPSSTKQATNPKSS